MIPQLLSPLKIMNIKTAFKITSYKVTRTLKQIWSKTSKQIETMTT